VSWALLDPALSIGAGIFHLAMVLYQDDLWPVIEDEFGLLRADEVVARAGYPNAGDGLVSVQPGGAPLYPGFQVDSTGRPLPVFEDLRQLADRHDVPHDTALLWATISTIRRASCAPFMASSTSSGDSCDSACRALSVRQTPHQFGVVLHHPGVHRFELGTPVLASLRLASPTVLPSSLIGIHGSRLRRTAVEGSSFAYQCWRIGP
jgi:hypothetical protein